MNRAFIILAALACILAAGCVRDERAHQEDVALFERMDSLEHLCQYAEMLAIGDSLLERLPKDDDSLRCEVLNLMGIANFRMSNLDEAVRYQRMCYDIDRRLGDSTLLSSDLNQLAAMSLKAQQFDVARSCIEEAIAIEEKLGRDDVLAIRLGLASEIYVKLQDYKRAEPYARRALQLDSAAGRWQKGAIRMSQLAAINLAQDTNRDETLALLTEAERLLQTTDNMLSLAIVHCQMGELSLKSDDKEAATHFAKALELARLMGEKHVEKRALGGLWEAQKKTIGINTYTHYIERYAALSDSLATAQAADEMNALRRQYETRELQLENERLQAENRLRLMVIIAIILLFVIAVIVVVLMRGSRLSKQRLMQQMERVRMNFFTNITHEFRTPLTVILGMGEDLARRPETRDAGHAIVQEGRGLLDLVNQLLDISKVNSSIGKAHWRHGNVVGYINMVVESLRPLAEKNHVELLFSPEQNEMEMDFVPDYICKIVRNLIANSLKYTSANGSILMACKRENGNLLLRIVDDGRGIAPADLIHIFDPFYQGDNSRITVGTGIGLSLVKLMVQAMDGTIVAKSSPNVGTAFIINLPLRHKKADEVTPIAPEETAALQGTIHVEETDDAETPEPDDSESPDPALIQKPIVLIAEDNANVSAYITSQLGSDYCIYTARNGADAMSRAEVLVPDLIITDLMMPVMDGIEFCQKIRANEALNHIPLIMLTAKANNSDRMEGLDAGADAYLTKPFNADELRLRVSRLIEQRRLLREKFQCALRSGNTTDVEMSDADRAFLDRVVNVVYSLMASYKKADINTVAEAFNMGVRTFTRKLQTITGESPMLYINRIKIEKAKRLLSSDTNYLLADIATRCGFEDPAYFSRIFKQITKASPSTYKKRVE